MDISMHRGEEMSFSKSLASFMVLLLCTVRAAPILAAGFDWQTATPESQGINRFKLEIMRDVLASRNTKALLIIRNDKVVTEWYAPGFSRTQRHFVASAAKGLAGGTALLVALNDGRIGIDDFASKYIPSWRTDPVKTKIQIKHLAAHTSGIEDAVGPEAWKQAFWDRIPDPFLVAIKEAPVIFSPGINMAYSNPGIAALDYALTASLKGTAQPDIQTILQERIMEPIGIPTSEWTIGYGTTYSLDGLELQATWGGASYTARAAARIGRLLLRQGNWQGQQLVGSAWATRMVAQVDSRFPSGLCWFNNALLNWRALPRDAYATAGAGHNILLVVPSLNLIVVRLGNNIIDDTDFWLGLEEYLFKPLLGAMEVGDTNSKITGIGHFKDDAQSDLVWQNQSSGHIGVSFMDDINRISASNFNPDQVTDDAWKIVGIGDFNSDSKPDLVWQNQSNGQIGVWFMDGINRISATNFSPGQVTDTGWKIVGTGDFNSDSKPDLVWQNQSNGSIGVWFMDGANLISTTNFNPGLVSDTAWKIVGIGDFSSDSKPDLVWQNQSNGQVGVWFMDGINLINASNFSPGQVTDTAWKIVGIGDFSSDSKPDLVWQNQSNGQIGVWFMDGIIHRGTRDYNGE